MPSNSRFTLPYINVSLFLYSDKPVLLICSGSAACSSWVQLKPPSSRPCLELLEYSLEFLQHSVNNSNQSKVRFMCFLELASSCCSPASVLLPRWPPTSSMFSTRKINSPEAAFTCPTLNCVAATLPDSQLDQLHSLHRDHRSQL